MDKQRHAELRRMFLNDLHQELNERFNVGLGDLESFVDIGYLYDVMATPEQAMALAGMCICEYIDGKCGVCQECDEANHASR